MRRPQPVPSSEEIVEQLEDWGISHVGVCSAEIFANTRTALHGRKQDVYFVSGGFRQMIEPVAALCDVSKDRIFANTFLFKPDGTFDKHLDSEPTSRAGGKAKVVADLKAQHGYKTVVMIGDGATDMEARDVPGGADAFIGFGGIAVREKVEKGADWFVLDFNDLIDELKK